MAEEGGACHMVGVRAAFLFQTAARVVASSAGPLCPLSLFEESTAIGQRLGVGLRGWDAALSLPVVGRRFLSLLGNNGEDNGCLNNVLERALG
jgi:hypothetical protein